MKFVGNLPSTFVKFTAKWCKPCKLIEPVFHELSEEHKKFTFVSIDIDDHEDIAAEYSVMSIPMFVVLNKSAEKVDKMSGKDESKLRALINKYV